MATITLTIPDALLPRVRTALCIYGKVPDTNANAKQVVVDWVKSTVLMVEYAAATQAAPPIPVPDVTGIVT